LAHRPVASPVNLDGRQNLVTFRLDRQIYALPIEPVVQILEMVTITLIPQASGSLEGVINVRGAAVPVLNMRRHFGIPQPSQQFDAHIILIQLGERTIGLMVDEVLTVLDLAADQIIHTTDILPQEMGQLPLLKGLVHAQDETVLLLDLASLWLPQQGQRLAEMVGIQEEE
jgi:purine-binding chemotaxis protein CheW